MKKTFKKMMGLALIAVMLVTTLVACSSTETGKNENDKVVADLTTDVVVIGSGGAGLAAAIEAKDAGKSVIVVEKMPMVGGNTLRATGGLNAAGTSSQAALGIEDSPESHYEDTMKGGYYKNDPELVNILAENAADAVEWLIGLGADLSDVGRMAGASQNRSHRPTGGAPVGAHLVSVLRDSALEKGIEILTQTTATEILLEDGSVVGIIATDKDNKEFTINSETVIIATGGFGANTTMFAEYDPSLTGFGSTNHPGATGDGIAMALKIGAALVDIEEIQTHPTVVPSNGYMITEAVRGNGAILINRDGERFVNELGTRDVVSEATLDQEGSTAFLFFDEGVRESLSAINGYVESGLTIQGDTLEALALEAGINLENLEATVEAYNNAVQEGVDSTFGRDDLPRSLENSQFYVIEVGPAVHHTMGGLKINEKAEVLDEAGNPIVGLFAAGEVTGGIHGGNRLGANALTDLIVFGRIAGINASK
ncbi:flavocytochrome c [Alkaliphilus transvaalensis]|uniref:flavocytochrome c n=1 Tax=Alkaliphilus transvaalensis TaxID=114628 RepID=UPI00047A6A0D|nr:flavocytochrome c [Alkaliphilus transvaalensis]